jgi:Flp pilus assembly pilin Flp
MQVISELVRGLLARFHREEGQDLAEYVLLVGVVVAIVVGAAFAAYEGAIQAAIQSVADAINS